MNDFLRNLRSPQKKETPPPKKTTDSRFYNQPDRRMVRDRRVASSYYSSSPSSAAETTDFSVKQIADTLPQFIDTTSIMAEQLERIASVNERVAESEIRKNNAISDFFEGLEKTLIERSPEAPFPDAPTATASYASGTHYTKDDIHSIINTMRDQGATFSVIADYLKEKGIPTFSGRGEWHAQTIHRLCK
jgi:hypothetical protein